MDRFPSSAKIGHEGVRSQAIERAAPDGKVGGGWSNPTLVGWPSPAFVLALDDIWVHRGVTPDSGVVADRTVQIAGSQIEMQPQERFSVDRTTPGNGVGPLALRWEGVRRRFLDRSIPKETAQGIRLQTYSAMMACLLIQQSSGRKPTKGMFEMISSDLMGLADRDELQDSLVKEAAKTVSKTTSRCIYRPDLLVVAWLMTLHRAGPMTENRPPSRQGQSTIGLE